MAKQSNKSNINQQFNVASKGLNLDNSQNNIQKGVLSYALNAAVENFDANSIQYQNEPGNTPCFDFPEGYVLLGKHFIPEKNKILFFLTNPDTPENEIGYMQDNDCVYRTLVNADCLNFDVNRPILGIVHRIAENDEVEIYWSDNNGRRYLNIDDIPYILLSTSDDCDPEDSSKLDCNKLLLQPKLNIPITKVSNVISGGEITSGTYQFTVQYSDAASNPYTSYYNVTNPTPIADIETATVNFNIPVGKSIVVNIENLNPTGPYKYFNLTVIKTVNNISTPELVGTYFIDDTSKQITYTGQNKTNIQLSISEIFETFPFYENADYVTAVQDILVWKGVTASERINYQKIANQIDLNWQTYRIPASDEGYKNEVNATNFRGYLRDEVYAFEIVFLLKNGKQTDAFHIPGKSLGPEESGKPLIQPDNLDYIGDGENPSPYWYVYNTASVIGTDAEYDATNVNYKGPFQHGKFAYWESTEEYPCDEAIWGELAGKKIRHHKFPDVAVSPIIENPNPVAGESDLQIQDAAIFPVGVKIDSEQIKRLVNESNELTQQDKDQIIGYKITRADRGVNKSIIAKGMLRNVGKYTKEEQDFYYPNYPYNDVNEDPFLNSVNNAWTELCEPFLLTVYELPENDEEGDYIKVEWTDCNTNKITDRKFRDVGTYDICSTTKPRVLSPGVTNKIFYTESGKFPQVSGENIATVNYKNYDIYIANSSGSLCSGWTVGWDSDYMSDEDEDEWVGGYNLFGGASRTRYVYVQVGTQPQRISGNVCGDTIELWDDTNRVEECKSEQPLTPINTGEKFRQVFNSPETSFGQPFLGDILKLESVMYGAGKAHFVEVKDSAKYRLITEEAQRDALSVAEKVAKLTQEFNLEAMFAVYNAQLTIFRNEITKRNFARSFNSIASYNYSVPVKNDKGTKQRNLDIKRYLIPEVLNVGDTDDEEKPININNWQRESSVYLKTTESLPIPSNVEDISLLSITDKSRFTIEEKGLCPNPEKETDISVVSYYGSLKNQFVNQYGQIYSYESIDTGFVKIFDTDLSENIIWGGDTFIGRFAYKTKVPFFIDNRVNFPDDSDIFYDEIGNIAYPKFWHSSRSILKTYYGTTNENLILSNFVSYKAHNFDCPNDQTLISEDADPSTNPNRTFYDGYYYLFAYGVPSFYCESSYNLDLRTAFNNREGDFWPHVSSGIPDDWVQETNVPIIQDNTYNYNVTFSKQNKESSITNLPADWDPENEIREYPFRAIYSDIQNTDADAKVNNWLIYRPLSYFDFPQNYGKLTALDGLKNKGILARFENKSLLYNSLVTIDTSNPQAAFVGNPNLFVNQPIDFAETDQGFIGSQNKMILKTPYGAVSVDAKRGHVFLINGTQAEDLSQFGSGMQRWFTAHLPFEIIKYFPGIDIDNHFNSIGLHGVFDSNYERVIITKLDYVPLNEDVIYENGKFYIEEKQLKKEIYLTDSDYFCNVSWTLSFNFNSKSWVSFHSYIPNWYVGENNFYYSGLNQCPNDFDAIVGVLDQTIPTTTSTTTIPLTTTTSTTIPEEIPDCTFDVVGELVDCALEGNAVFIGEETMPDCKRPKGLPEFNLLTGFTLVTPSATVDSTSSQESACAHVTTYLANDGNDTNYTPTILVVQATQIALSAVLYDRLSGNDCTVISDGWYFTDQLAQESNSVFEVQDGHIVQIVECGVEETTTTTTTTTNNNIQELCYTGTLTEPNNNYPLGGIVVYIDGNGDQQTVSEIWDVDTITIFAIDVISTSNVDNVICP